MKRLLAVLFTALFVISFPQLSHADTLDEIKTLVQDNYVGTLNGNPQDAKSIDEVVQMLDPYSTYFTKEEYNQFLNSVDYKTVGIGVVIEKHDKGILIVQVIDGGSASSSGIVSGDIITEIEGKSAAPMTTQEASSLILGAENTPVTLKILKQNGNYETVSVVRKPFSVPNVTTQLLYGKVGYIHLSSFSSDGAQLVANAYNQLKKQGAKSYILDLQNNGGGYVSTAEQLIGMFPNAPQAFKLQTTTETTFEPAVKQSVVFPAHTKLLINRYSASASEMTAAALLDQKAADLYGEKSYGKGCMQNFFELSDGSLFKLTVGIFSGPKGTNINKIGVTPTVQTTSDPIFKAHFDSIAGQLLAYKKLASLANVPTSKTFTVKFSKPLQTSQATNVAELVALGTSQTAETDIQVNGAKLVITPKKPLEAGAEYMLIVHPKVKDAEGKLLKRGSYLHITVAAN